MNAPIPAAKPLLLDALGIDFLVYVLGSDEEEIRLWIGGEIELGTLQKMQASRELWQLMQSFPLGDDEAQRSFHIANLLGQYLESTQRTIAGTVRGIAVGDDRPIATGDEIRDSVGRIVSDYYPIYLLPQLPGLPPSMQRPMMWNHPARLEFEAAVKRDGDLMRLYSSESEEQGPNGLVLRSTGSGGTIQLWSLLSSVMGEAWDVERARKGALPTPQELTETTLDQLQTIRDAAAGRPARTNVRVGLTGILLPDGVEINLGWGKLRHVTDSDLESVPAELQTELTYADESGEVRISYAGNVVFESTANYKVKVLTAEDFMRGHEWPDDFNEYAKLSAVLDSIRLALLFLDPADPPIVFPAWQTIGDPLEVGRRVSFQDLKRMPGLRPLRLTEDKATLWSNYLETVRSVRSHKIDVAIRRAVRAAAERNDPEDVLVDSVVAWENLVGSRQGEPTLRVSGALAWLLEPGVEQGVRDQRRREIGKLYNLRSDIVHGNRPLKPSEQVEKPQDALRIALQALYALLIQRPELLAECATSDERSARLLMGG